MGFDTTSSNTGIRKGACTILQEVLQRQLLWMACRHHVLELVIGAAFGELFGATSGPEVPIFKKLQDIWPRFNRSNTARHPRLSQGKVRGGTQLH